MTRYFVGANGKYLGGFDTDPNYYPVGGIGVPMAPRHALDTWDGAKWVAYTSLPLTLDEKLAPFGITVAELKAELAK